MSPMWLTSKTPTLFLTALCSAIIPPLAGYSTGISQPLNSTILAPIWRCTAFKAVLRMVGVVASTADNGQILYQQWLCCRDGETHYRITQCAQASTAGATSSFPDLRCPIGDMTGPTKISANTSERFEPESAAREKRTPPLRLSFNMGSRTGRLLRSRNEGTTLRLRVCCMPGPAQDSSWFGPKCWLPSCPRLNQQPKANQQGTIRSQPSPDILRTPVASYRKSLPR